MKLHTLTIRHQDGDCVYDVESVMLNVDVNGLDLEINTKENPDCVLGFLPTPPLYVESGTISVSTADDNIFRIYIGQYQALDNNIVRFASACCRAITKWKLDWTWRIHRSNVRLVTIK